jgi:predicted dehydrogenase
VVRVTALRIVHVGLGLWGRDWARIVARAKGYELVGVVDSSPRARAWGEETLGVPARRTLAAALRHERPDAVLLVSPPETHRALAEEALDAGAHVIVEKPLAPSMGDARALAAASAAAARHVVVVQNYRFRRQPAALRELLGDGVLGRLLGVRIAFHWDMRGKWISPRDWRGRMPHPLIVDMAIHHVDLLRYVTGREVCRVDARSWSAPDGPFLHEPLVDALLDLDDGTPVAYRGSWVGPDPNTSWNGDWELVGERARASWVGGHADALKGRVVLERYGKRPARVRLPRLAAIDREGVLADLRRAIEAGGVPRTPAADNLRTLATVFALARSVEERAPVDVEDVLGP